MLKPALKYLTLRSFGAPAVLLSLAMQGVFRGFKDTKTPLYATGNNLFFSFLSINLNDFFLSSFTLLRFALQLQQIFQILS